MSNIIPFSAAGNTEVPAHLAALFDGEGNIAPRVSINQLSYKGKVWRRIVDGEETQLKRKNKETGDDEDIPIVAVVVLDHNKGRSRAFYEGKFVDGENKAPRCSSMDGVKPDASISEPIAATCASCPNAVKGSLITENNKQSTLCSPFKRIAVVPTAMIGKHPAMLLRMAQTSVWDKNNPQEAQGWYAWDQYVDMLRARGAKHTAAVETRVKFDSDKAYPKLLFSASRWLNPEEAAAAKARLGSSVDELGKILNGAGSDGVAGLPGVSPEGVTAGDAQSAASAGPSADAVAAQAAAAAAALAAAEADKKVKAAAAKAAKAAQAAAAEAAAKAAAQAAAAAAAAAASDDSGFGGGEDDSGFGAAAPVAAAPAAAAATNTAAAASPAAAVETGTPAGLADLLNGWDA